MYASRDRFRGQNGFTLIELLVAVLIIGILSGIAIPAFLGQRQKAQDSTAKSMSRAAATAAVGYGTEKNQDYSAMVIGDLSTIEPTLTDGGGVKTVASIAETSANGFTVTTQSKSDKWFSITRTSSTSIRCTATGATAPTAACTGNSTW